MTYQITGRHLKLLGELFNPFEVQMLTGIFKSNISKYTSQDYIDAPLNDVCCCFVIRTLLRNPELSPLKKFNNHGDLLAKLPSLSYSFPFPREQSDTGIYIGRSSASSYSLSRGSSEMTAISIWITILLSHIDDMNKNVEGNIIYQIMEEEALSRFNDGLEFVYEKKGWPKPSSHLVNAKRSVARITGRDILDLQKNEKYNFDNIQIQYLLGSFMAYIATATNKDNIDLPIADPTRSMIVRYLKRYSDKALLPDLVTFEEFKNLIIDLDGILPFPTTISKLGLILGRAGSTIHALNASNIDRRQMPVLSIWSTMLCLELPAIKRHKRKHPMIETIFDEAKARNHNIPELIRHGGWPKKIH